MKTRKRQGHSAPPLPVRIRQLLNRTYATHGSAEHMSLDRWRDLEQELERRLKQEDQEHQR